MNAAIDRRTIAPNRACRPSLFAVFALGLLLAPVANQTCLGQAGWFEGQRWAVRRPVALNAAPVEGGVCVVEFLCHGQLTTMQPDVRVVADGESVPQRILQRGPADEMRLAFLTQPGQRRYELYYGGTAAAPVPEWDSTHGLLFEARRYRDCDLSRLDSVLRAFDEADPLGADFVPSVFLGHLPFADNETPVLVRFQGQLRVPQAGKYRFYTSSRDASWLRIDGNTVAAWPGHHGASARGQHAGDMELTEGLHKLEYVNAVPDGGLLCVAAWQPPGAEKPAPLPDKAFGAVSRGAVGNPELRLRGVQPDFRIETLAEATLGPDRPRLIRIRFVPGIGRGPYRWEFGDGQSEIAERPEHVYLRPGDYRVRCLRTASRAEITHAIHVAPPWARLAEEDAQADVADWLPELKGYDPTALPAESLHQLVHVFRELDEFALAVAAGRTGLTERRRGAAELEPQAAARTALTCAQVADRSLNKPDEAIALCDLGLNHASEGVDAVRLWLNSARLALQHGSLEDAQNRLLQAQSLSSEALPADVRRELAVVQGDAARRMRQLHAARQFYSAAQQLAASAQWDVRRKVALQGVHSRAVEDALREDAPQAAAAQLREWVDEMPDCKLDGYYALLQARCLLTRDRFVAAIREAEDFLSVSPANPYADRLLLVAAEAESRRGNADSSRAYLERLLQAYPGSPEVPRARTLLEEGFSSQRDSRTAPRDQPAPD